MKKFIVTAVGLALIVTFSLLRQVWAGFIYLALAFIVALCLFWLVVLIKDYIDDYHKNIEDDYNLYKAKLVNCREITLEQIEQNSKHYLKRFKRSQWKEKGIEILKITFVLGVLIASVVLCFTLKI